MEKYKIIVSAPSDREAVAAILFKNGYAVKLVKEKNGSRTAMSIEYWRESDENNA